MKFYDRINELSILQENEQQSYHSAVFTVLMGRRRVGKTSLITKGNGIGAVHTSRQLVGS